MGTKVLIIGAGELGRALNFVLAQHSASQIWLWDRKPEKIDYWRPLDETIISVEPEFIFLAIPTQAVVEVTSKILKVRRENFSLVLFSKGLGPQGETALELIEQVWLGPLAIISGPMLAEELLQGLETAALVAGNLPQTVDRLVEIFQKTHLSLETTDDLIGLSWAGPLKNIYAIGLGIIDRYRRGSNYRGWFLTRAIKEMAELIKFFGGKKETAYSLAGLGDLLATGLSPYSSNYQFGFNLGEGKKSDHQPEGVTTALGLKKRLGEKTTHWPLLNKIIGEITKKFSSFCP